MEKIKYFILGLIASAILFGSGVYAATTYAINSSNVEYKDNSSLGVTNVQAAIDGTCTKFNTQLTSLKADIVDTIYPVGSIYVSETDSTVTAVQNRFKTFGKTTTWVAYGSGKTLVGSGTGTDANGTTQTFSVSNNSKNLGEYTHKLIISEMPKHSHPQNVLSNPGTGTYSGRKDYVGDYENMSFYNQGVPTNLTGGDGYHNNIQPYVTVYMYKRTA